ncbi:GNAT family N-acetyltransferase [Novosphingobium sp. M1R2S20]|uniref:N-acetyltransferase family protein n=1 Tax=Novosphingobium rhizovicinum TaxID=3228928 RepID=A0ABV3RCA3_9SPHN
MYAPVEWSIRAAGCEDVDALALVASATFLDAYAGAIDGAALIEHCLHQHSADAYRALLDQGARAWLVSMEPGGAPIGYALACESDLEQARPGDWELKRIYLLSRFHGTGISAALLRAVIDGAQGRPRLLLGVKKDNHRALRFYRKHGFIEAGARTFQVGAQRFDDFVLARPLIPATSET